MYQIIGILVNSRGKTEAGSLEVDLSMNIPCAPKETRSTKPR